MVQHASHMIQKMLGSINEKGRGLEIAPYFDPCLSDKDYDVIYTDYISNEEIQAKARINPGFHEQDIPHVSFVWKPGAPLTESVPSGEKFDYVIASHVMEHVPNPVGWLNDILSVTKTGGNVALFLPDHFYSPDYFRRETSVNQALALWIEQPPFPTPEQIIDFMLDGRSVTVDTYLDWNIKETLDALPRHYSDEDAVSTASSIYADPRYLDIHCTVWNHKTFKQTFDRLLEIGIINAEVQEVTFSNGEFLAVLKKRGEPLRQPPAKRPFTGAEPNSAKFENIIHQLNIVRHDLNFLTKLVAKTEDDAAGDDKLVDKLKKLIGASH